jgi:type IV pilus assembly protein PilW
MIELQRPLPVGSSITRRQGGFTMVELMVAITIGLVLSLAVTGTILTMGRQFRVVGANAAAQGNAQIALALLDSAGRSAGAGFFNSGQPLCSVWNAWKDGTVIANGDVFMPAFIEDSGSDSESDTLVFTSSNSAGALSGIPLVGSAASAGGNLLVSNVGNIADEDLALVGVPGLADTPCTLFQLTEEPTVLLGVACGASATQCKILPRTGSTTGYNPPDPAMVFASAPVYGAETSASAVGPAVVNRLGSIQRQGFTVLCNSLVQYDAMEPVLPTCTQNPLAFAKGVGASASSPEPNALAMDVVLMHAQYGVTDVATSDVVTSWVDATGSWATPSATDAARIKAVRVVVVVRSKEAESTDVSEPCTAASAASGVVNNGPCSFQDAAAPVIDLSPSSALPSGKTWQNYRYRVHRAVIPLRNVIWST